VFRDKGCELLLGSRRTLSIQSYRFIQSENIRQFSHFFES